MDEKLLFEKFISWTKKNTFSLENLFPTVLKNKAVHIDLSIQNNTVKTEEEFNKIGRAHV